MSRVSAAVRSRPTAALLILALLAVAYVTPIWLSRLDAPQYPKGLWLVVYAGRLEGDVAEVNALNHYIGMQTLSPDTVPELGLWWLALTSSAAFAAAGLFARGAPGLLARIALWAVPLAVLVDIQRWLYRFGHELSPDAALRMKPFTPLALGPTKVWNFEILSLPGPGLLILVLVAVIVLLVPRSGSGVSLHAVLRAARVTSLLLVVAVGPALACGPASPGTAAGVEHGHQATLLDLGAAIRAAAPGSTIHVADGRYAPLVIDRPIRLVAHGGAVIDSGGRGTPLTINASDVSVEGFVIEGSGGQTDDGAGILVTGDRVSISRTTIRGAYVGVLARDTQDLRIVSNAIRGVATRGADGALDAAHHDRAGAVGDGIWLHATRSTLIRDNDIIAMRDGVYLSYARETLMDGNRISDLRYGVHAMFGSDLMIFGNTLERNSSGLVLMNTTSLEASRNVILDHRSDATGYGVLLKDTAGVRLVENVIARGQVGIRAEGVDRRSAPADVLTNRITDNAIGVQLFPTARLVFSRNSFVRNLVQIDTPGAASANGSEWIKSGMGNEWSTYAGYDLDDDGTGDVAHTEGGAAQRLLTASAELRVLRTSVAYALLARAERWWDLGGAQRIVDRIPLTRPLAPDLPAAQRSLTDAIAFAAAGLVLVGALALVARSSR